MATTYGAPRPGIDDPARYVNWEAVDEAGGAELAGYLPDVARLLGLVQALSADEISCDRAAILAAAAEAGDTVTRRVLTFCPSEFVSAALGWNRAAVEKRVRHNALQGIEAFGLLPLADGETVLDRYLALREIAKRGPKLGPNRRHSHAAAVAAAMGHLAHVAGHPDADRLEWDCEARIVTETLEEWQLDGYTATLRMAGADPVLTIIKAGKQLKSVPAAVRAHPGYAQVREHQERLRAQARRMRTGLVERLVATGGTVTPDELARYRSLPAGAAMLPAVIWQDQAGAIGLLDQIDATGPIAAAHPYLLHQREALAHWQAEIVHRRIRQPVKQAFRELYLLTSAERAAGDVSRRFADHLVDGKTAAQLLSTRGWSVHDEYADHQATRRVGADLTAALNCGLSGGHFGGGEVMVGELCFWSGGAVLPLTEVPPTTFSEVMRDLDLVVSVAGGAPESVPSRFAVSRAELLATLIADLQLDRVTVDGTAAVVVGTRATYRVHLTSGSIHVEPGGHLCVVPASFGGAAHRNLFLPFADEDQQTSVILSKVFLLAEDDRITDRSILSQLDRLTDQ